MFLFSACSRLPKIALRMGAIGFLFLTAFLLQACDSKPQSATLPDPIRFVPANAQTVMHIDSLQISTEESHQDLSSFSVLTSFLLFIWNFGMLENGEPYHPIIDALASMAQSDAEESGQFATKAMMFSDIELLSHAGFEDDDGSIRAAYVVTGEFDSSEFYRSFKDASPVPPEAIEYKGVNLLVDGHADFSSGIIDDGVLVFGTSSLVRSTIDVGVGGIPPLTAKLFDAYSLLGEQSISLAMTVPGGGQDHVLDFFESIANTNGRLAYSGAWYEVLGVGISRVGDINKAIVVLEHLDAESANSYAKLIKGLIEQADIPDSVEEPLDILKVSTEGSRVFFNLEATDEQLALALQWIFRDGFIPVLGY